ncbi:MAG: glucuronyl hydrolase [Nitrosomonas sp.]|nr:MAG: glucuronyl hydrolase [Nitrosomonas sp.]
MFAAGNTDPGDQLVSPKEMIDAIESMFRRMEAIDALCSNGFPLFSPGNSNTWTVSQGGSWFGGFWGACWWLRAKITDSARDQHKASTICRQLAAKTTIDSGYRSMIFWYGAALGEVWFRDAHARSLVQESMIAITQSFNPKLNCFPLGTALGGGDSGNRTVTVDSLAALIQLFGSSRQKLHHAMTRRHVETLLAACSSTNGAFHAAARFNGRGFEPTGQAGQWSRGQAWTMLGLSRAAAYWGEPFVTHARAACEYWLISRPEPLPPNRIDEASPYCDPSASVIASLAMLALAGLVPDGGYWRSAAHRQISAVLRSRYFTGYQAGMVQSDRRAGTVPGIFWGCCYHTRPDKEELVEATWGCFFLMAALCVLTGSTEPGHC